MRKFTLGLLLSVLAVPAYATTWNSASCSYTDVNYYAGNGAGSSLVVDGDIVLIPSCSATTWTTRLTITKAITLQGGGIGNTTIRNGVNPDGRMISWTLVASKDARLSGMTINDNGAAQAQFGVLELIGASGGRIRVDHVKFDHPNGFNIMTYSLRGVFDHNEFVWSTSGSIPIYVFDPGNSTYGDESWNSAVAWGGADFLFVENNTFTYEMTTGFCSDGFRGTRVVYRFNTVANCSFQNHGTETSGRSRGGRAMEVYHNTFSGTTTEFMALRSGSGLSWGNTGPTGLNAASLTNDRNVFSFYWSGQADGTNRWDVNDPGSPFTSGTASGGGSLSMTVAGNPWSPNQYQGYQVLKTSSCVYPAQCTSPILSNTTNTLTLTGNGGFGTDISFSNGETFQINKVTESLDQPGRGGGSLFSIVHHASGSVSAGTATINFNSAHGLATNDQISLLDFGNATYNGIFTITVTDSTHFTYACSACSGSAGGGDVFKIPVAFNDQVDFPIYQWQNTANSVNTNVQVNNNASGIVRVNEHYYNYGGVTQTNATTPFDGTSGMGVGTIANRPTTCATGVAYWATNEGEWDSTNGATADGKMYICTATNTWSARYGAGSGNSTGLPYTYPHPLVEASIVSINPSSAAQASSGSFTITGSLTSWINGTTVASFGTGVTVNSTTCSSTTSCSVSLTIDPAAIVGGRTVTMTTNATVDTLTNGFTITALITPPVNSGGTRTLIRAH